MKRFNSLSAIITLFLVFSSVETRAIHIDADISTLFNNYQRSMNSYVQALSRNDWQSAYQKATQLKEQSEHLHQLGIESGNKVWEYYASNLLHHCIELTETSLAHQKAESIYLVAVLIGHIDQIQSSNPFWLRHHVGLQIRILEDALVSRNKAEARNAAEVIHTAANKILLSVTSSPGSYKHSYWTGNIIRMNGLGDQILGEVNQGDWDDIPAKLSHIKHIYDKWSSSFQEKP